MLRIDCRHRENEIAKAQDMVSEGLELLQAAGASVQEIRSFPWELGLAIHEAGTCRMGDDRRTSVVDGSSRLHDLENVICADSSVFVTSAGYNPTLTLVALAHRAASLLAGGVA